MTNNQEEHVSIQSTQAIGYRGIGIRRRSQNQTLDVTYSVLWAVYPDSTLEEICCQLFTTQSSKNGIEKIPFDFLRKVIDALLTHKNSADLGEDNLKALVRYQDFLKNLRSATHNYYEVDFIAARFFDFTHEPDGIEDIYLRLQVISHRYQLPHSINLSGVFGLLPNLVWTTQGPVSPEDYPGLRDKSLLGYYPPLVVTHVDKFPYLVNYHIPSGVRITDAARVRLGAYLSEGTTVMPAGYINFNAGTKGAAMVEGRISSGVIVGENSDIGGGASIMGTLSGGNKHVIEIGAKCLLGANSGTGISLGFGCTIAAGTYVTAASKVFLYDREMKPVNLAGVSVFEGKNIVKAVELSGRDHLLFYLDTARGKLVCRPNPKTINLNPHLH